MRFYRYLNWYAWATCFIWLFFSVVVVVVNSILIYTAIRKQEQRNAKYLGALLQGTGAAPSTSNLTLPSLSNMFHSQGSLKINENEIIINTSCPTRNDVRPESTAPVNTIVADAESGNSTPIATEDALFRNPHHHGGGPSLNQDVVVARKMKQSRTAAVQSSLYCGSAFFTTFWWFLIWLIGNFWVLGISSVTTRTFVFLAMMVTIVLPSQGIFNLFIFVRLQYLQPRSNHQDWSRWRCMKQCMFSAA
jgi:hypothetical protein